MTIPDRSEAARLLRSLDPPGWFIRHACAVADVASWIAARTSARGHPLDRDAVEAGALLHDVDKLRGATMAGLRHGDGSAAWLERRGHGELAALVRDHPVTRLAEPRYEGWLAGASTEALIVAYADKRAGQRLESMDARFGSWHRRYPGGWDAETALVVRRRARELEDAVCRAAGVAPTQVRRLRWSRRLVSGTGA